MVMTLLDDIQPDSALPELRFPGGLPGFPGEERFALVRWGGDDSPFSLLKSLETPELEFLVVPPNVFFPDYAPDVDDDTVAALGLEGADDALVLVIVSLADAPEDATANLLGPIVINLRSRVGAQAVLVRGDHDPQRRLVDA